LYLPTNGSIASFSSAYIPPQSTLTVTFVATFSRGKTGVATLGLDCGFVTRGGFHLGHVSVLSFFEMSID